MELGKLELGKSHGILKAVQEFCPLGLLILRDVFGFELKLENQESVLKKIKLSQ